MALMTSGFCELEHSKFLNSQDYIEGERDSDSKTKKCQRRRIVTLYHPSKKERAKNNK